MSITVTLPIAQENIEAECKKLRNEIKRLEAEEKCAWAMLKAVQECCSHPQRNNKIHGNPCIVCDHCNYWGP